MPAEAVITAARSWIDTPIFHRGRTHAGIDCLGLIICAGVSSGAMPDPDEASWPDADYGRLPNPKFLVKACDHFLVPIELGASGPGDVVGMTWGLAGAVMHLGIRATFDGRPSLIHANPRAATKKFRKGRVVETGFEGQWAANAELAWRYPLVVR